MAKKENNKTLIAAISYLPFVGLVLLFVYNKDKFVTFHAKNGTALTLLWIITSIIGSIPVIGFGFIAWALGILCIVIFVYGIILALQEKQTKIPAITDLGKKIADILNIK
jgi:uncharacterized membrane protein